MSRRESISVSHSYSAGATTVCGTDAATLVLIGGMRGDTRPERSGGLVYDGLVTLRERSPMGRTEGSGIPIGSVLI